MSIQIIDKLTQKNNGTFKLMDLKDVDYDGTGKSAKDKIDSLPSALLLSDDNKLYLQDSNGNKIGDGIELRTSSVESVGDFMYYDDTTGEITIESGTLDGFEYIDI